MDALATAAKTVSAAFASLVSLFEALAVVSSFKLGLGANMQAEAARVSKSLEEIGAKWKATMATIFAAEAGGEHGAGHKDDVAEMQLRLKEALRAQQEKLQERIKIADDAYKAEAERLNAAVKVFAITESEKTAQQLAALNERDIQEQHYLQKQLALWKENSPEYVKILNEMTNAHGKFLDDVQKLNEQQRAANVKEWEGMLTPIQSAWDSQLRGLLAGTTSWAQAMKSIIGDLVIDMIKALESFAVKKAALALADVMGPNPLAFANALKGIQPISGKCLPA
jgi:hypothetical protein